jgi:hypothetical protein
MENRQEIKEGVKNKLIEKLADQIAQESDFEQLKKELSAELLSFKNEKPLQHEIGKSMEDKIPTDNNGERLRTLSGREFNSDGGLFPANTYEEKYKRAFGFVYDPTPINERFKDKFDKFGGSEKRAVFSPFVDVDTNNINDELSKLGGNNLVNKIKEEMQKFEKELSKKYSDPYADSIKEEKKTSVETEANKDMSSGTTFTSFLSTEPEITNNEFSENKKEKSIKRKQVKSKTKKAPTKKKRG